MHVQTLPSLVKVKFYVKTWYFAYKMRKLIYSQKSLYIILFLDRAHYKVAKRFYYYTQQISSAHLRFLANSVLHVIHCCLKKSFNVKTWYFAYEKRKLIYSQKSMYIILFLDRKHYKVAMRFYYYTQQISSAHLRFLANSVLHVIHCCLKKSFCSNGTNSKLSALRHKFY